jgi:hypothetical protein
VSQLPEKYDEDAASRKINYLWNVAETILSYSYLFQLLIPAKMDGTIL